MTDRIMVDIETLGLEPGAAIISLGAVRFDAGKMGEVFERSISLTSCQDAGLHIGADTLEWWLDQDAAAREQLLGGDDIDDVLADFAAWYDAEEVWANSPAFDCAILAEAFDRVGVDVPWEFYERRDYRTLSELPVVPEKDHDGVALDDAGHQAHVAATALKRLEEGWSRGERR